MGDLIARARFDAQPFIKIKTNTENYLNDAYELEVPAFFISSETFLSSIGEECAKHIWNETSGEAFEVNDDFKIYIWVRNDDYEWQPFGQLDCSTEPTINYYIDSELHEFEDETFEDVTSQESEGAA